MPLFTRNLRLFSTELNSKISKELVYESFGCPTEQIKLRSRELKMIGDRNLQIRFLASPINPSDLNMIEGSYLLKPSNFPAVGGNEGVAIVEAVGKDVIGFQIGDLVVPSKPLLGCWRERTCVDGSDVVIIPKDGKTLPIEVLATLNVNPPTAYRLLRDFVKLNPDDVIIQNGANSAVGRLIIQMASLIGVRTVNIVRDRENFKEVAKELKNLVKKQPADSVNVIKPEELSFNLVKNISEGKMPVLGLNCVGGSGVGDMARVMERGGVIVSYGGMSKRPITLPVGPFIFNDLTLKGFWLTDWYARHPDPSDLARIEMFRELISLFKTGQLEGVKFKEFNFESEWLDAIRDAQRPFHDHKCILKMKHIG